MMSAREAVTNAYEAVAASFQRGDADSIAAHTQMMRSSSFQAHRSSKVRAQFEKPGESSLGLAETRSGSIFARSRRAGTWPLTPAS